MFLIEAWRAIAPNGTLEFLIIIAWIYILAED